MKTIQDRINTAIELLDAGFTSKARQKDALDQLTRAYDMARDTIHSQVISAYQPGEGHTDTEWADYVAKLNEFELPYSLHHLKPKHIAKASEMDDRAAETMKLLSQLRAEVKAAKVEKVQPKKAEPSEYQVKAEKTILEMMEKRKAQYLEAVDLGREFGGLPVSANVHWVVNQYGHGFPRTFFYLSGKLTPLNVIIAAAQTLADEKKAQ